MSRPVKCCIAHEVFQATSGPCMMPLIYPAHRVGEAVQDLVGESVERPVESYENVGDAVYVGITALGPEWNSED